MVLEPFSALGAACNIIQLVEVCCKLCSEGRQIYKNGTTVDRKELETATEWLQQLCDGLIAHQTAITLLSPDSEEYKLQALARDCKSDAEEFLKALNRLKVQGGGKTWQSFRVALKSVWKKSYLEAMDKRLTAHRMELNLQLAAMQRSELKSGLLSLAQLDRENKKLGMQVKSDIEHLRTEIKDSITALHKEISNLDSTKKSGIGVLTFPKTRDKYKEPTTGLADVIAGSEKLASLALLGNKIVREFTTAQKILQSLRYRTMRMRHSKIANAHPNTYRWLFKPSDIKNPHSTWFVEWTTSSTSIYWVTGKPGSGKSTLMKLLADEDTTRTLLQRWAGDRKLIIASFYFWVAGTPIQKSQEGLLRSLLYEIGSQSLDLIKVLFPARWAEPDTYHDDPEPWTYAELMRAFNILQQQDLQALCFCFFIDGLDEYEGDHADLIEVVKLLASSLSFKICLSSRPWNVFQAAFADSSIPKIYLQDFNRADIVLYVKEKLETRREFVNLKERDPEGGSMSTQIVDELVSKSRGVFLWVQLVVRSLIEGLENSDRLFDLQRRVNRFPEDLEDFFKHMLYSLDPVYRQQASRAFAIALCEDRPLPLLAYWFLDIEELDHDFFITSRDCPTSPSRAAQCSEEMKRRINGRSKGLLEVSFQKYDHYLLEYQVEFLHRTVKDFLLTKDVQNLLLEWIEPGFNAPAILCRIYVMFVKCCGFHGDNIIMRSTINDLMRGFASNALRFEEEQQSSPSQLLLDFGTTARNLVQSIPYTESNFLANKLCPSNGTLLSTLIDFAIEVGLYHSVQYLLNSYPGRLSKKDSDRFLKSALEPAPNNWLRNRPNLKMTTLLLEKGADPNQAWNQFMGSAVNLHPDSKALNEYLSGQEAEELLQAVRSKQSVIKRLFSWV